MHVGVYLRMHVCMYVCMYVRMTAGNLPFLSQLDTEYVCMYVCVYVTHLCATPAVQLLRIQPDLCKKANDCTGVGIQEGHASDEAERMSG